MNSTDIMIHINESLTEANQQELELEMRNIEGVIASRFNKPHLLVVAYDAELIGSPELLKHVMRKGYHAQLVGL
ncbi:MAG: ATP-binding protein [Candidatus Thiodiazotropha sp.]